MESDKECANAYWPLYESEASVNINVKVLDRDLSDILPDLIKAMNNMSFSEATTGFLLGVCMQISRLKNGSDS